MMFGYATDETPEMMPLTLMLASKICSRLAEVRRNGIMPYLRPDGKSQVRFSIVSFVILSSCYFASLILQVTVEYSRASDGAVIPIRLHTIVISAQHDDVVQYAQLKADLLQHVIQAVVPAKYIDSSTIFHLNPSKRFVIGGPTGDSGLTGRKIIVDTCWLCCFLFSFSISFSFVVSLLSFFVCDLPFSFSFCFSVVDGGWGAHGGGAFSGKDCTKVDRSAAYIARQIAKSVVASHLAKRVLVQLSYAIGVVEPLSIFVDTYGSGVVPDGTFVELIRANFDMRPGLLFCPIRVFLSHVSDYSCSFCCISGCIIRDLQLDRPKFAKTACYGHFGRSDPDFTWEVPKTLTLPH